MNRNCKLFIYICFLLLIQVSLALANDTLQSEENVVISEPYHIASPAIGFVQKLINDPGLPIVITVLILLLMLVHMFGKLKNGLGRLVAWESEYSAEELYDLKEKYSTYNATHATFKFLTPLVALLYIIYISVKGTQSQGYIMEWLNLVTRWAHVVAGIMWIGASFYFVFLENNLNRTRNIREELAGNLWAVHGGGFYFLEKYKVAPKKIPKDLHWFKYEAYFTFLTGLLLLIVVYYLDANAFLLDPSIEFITAPIAIGIGMGSLIIGWVVYDQMCKSVLIEKPVLFSVTGFILLIGMVYFLTQTLNPRAAYIHVGGIIGAIMVGNVFFNIIPAQKSMVRAATLGKPLDASLGIKAGQRSYHNNYFTLPVIFIMISNHFPSTFGHEYNWAVLAIIFLISTGIKHYWNLLEKGIIKNKLLAFSIAGFLGLILVISPAFEAKMDLSIPVSFTEVNEIIQTRCVTCHSANPSDDIWKAAPNGVMYDTPGQIKALSDKIMTRAVRSKTMPQGNKTKMTDAERKVLKRWILQGSNIDI